MIFFTLQGCEPCKLYNISMLLQMICALFLAPAKIPVIEKTMRPYPGRIVYQWEALTLEELRGFLVEYQVNVSESVVGCSHTSNLRTLTTYDSKIEIPNLKPTEAYCVSVRARTSVNYGRATNLIYVPCKLLVPFTARMLSQVFFFFHFQCLRTAFLNSKWSNFITAENGW